MRCTNLFRTGRRGGGESRGRALYGPRWGGTWDNRFNETDWAEEQRRVRLTPPGAEHPEMLQRRAEPGGLSHSPQLSSNHALLTKSVHTVPPLTPCWPADWNSFKKVERMINFARLHSLFSHPVTEDTHTKAVCTFRIHSFHLINMGQICTCACSIPIYTLKCVGGCALIRTFLLSPVGEQVNELRCQVFQMNCIDEIINISAFMPNTYWNKQH